MENDEEAMERRYQQFIQEVVATDLVWYLGSENGEIAITSSEDYVYTSGEEVLVALFWSEKNTAEMCGVQHWPDCELTSISLTDFLEEWCPDMHFEGQLVGVDLDLELEGEEYQPIKLVLDILEVLLEEKKELPFTVFDNVQQYYEETKSAYQELLDQGKNN